MQVEIQNTQNPGWTEYYNMNADTFANEFSVNVSYVCCTFHIKKSGKERKGNHYKENLFVGSFPSWRSSCLCQWYRIRNNQCKDKRKKSWKITTYRPNITNYIIYHRHSVNTDKSKVNINILCLVFATICHFFVSVACWRL